MEEIIFRQFFGCGINKTFWPEYSPLQKWHSVSIYFWWVKGLETQIFGYGEPTGGAEIYQEADFWFSPFFPIFVPKKRDSSQIKGTSAPKNRKKGKNLKSPSFPTYVGYL